MVEVATRREGVGRRLVHVGRPGARETGGGSFHFDVVDAPAPFFLDSRGFNPARGGRPAPRQETHGGPTA